MRQNKDGYILIYIVLLSAFLVLFFASFQGEIKKSIRSSEGSAASVIEDSVLSDHLSGLASRPVISERIDATRRLVSLELSSAGCSGSVMSDVPREYLIRSSGSTTALSFTVSSGWPVAYRLIGWNYGQEVSATGVVVGIASMGTPVSMPRAVPYDAHLLYVESLGGLAWYQISGASAIVPETSYYRLVRNINGISRGEGIYPVTNFLPKGLAGIDYEGLGMYLKE